ncbi:hypothetical protein ACLWBD_02590 [Bdellovibrio sp. HCB117]|uniref:hypothetical protein n=1 Tax=Bdellovibrio sp. HCB117 TaxID=3394359 RepID=UPI0039B54436
MKHKISKLMLFAALIPLWGCVEVKDKEVGVAPPATPAPKMIERKFSDLVVNQDLYLYKGGFRTKQEMEALIANEGLSRDVQTYSLQFQKITFSAEGRLFTMGHAVTLKAEELISEEGHILTFPEEQVAPLGHEGRHGGHIALIATNAEGLLNIVLRGENGGQGHPGKDPDLALKGKKGKDANSGLCVNGNIREACTPDPGGQGLPGYQGLQGHRGGNTGTLSLEIKSKSEFQPKIYRLVGKGGPGGVGGKGGQGGDGGDSINRKKPRVGAGSQGPEGPQGKPGPDGQDGIQESVCAVNESGANCI